MEVVEEAGRPVRYPARAASQAALEGTMKTYYLIMAIAASVAALAMATQLHAPVSGDREAEIEAETEQWFI